MLLGEEHSLVKCSVRREKMKIKSLSLLIECCHYSFPHLFCHVSNYEWIDLILCMSRFQPQKSEYRVSAASALVCATSNLCSVTKSEKWPKWSHNVFNQKFTKFLWSIRLSSLHSKIVTTENLRCFLPVMFLQLNPFTGILLPADQQNR